MYKRIDPKMNLPKMEEEILKFWEENKIFEKSVEKNSANKPFVFYEGPPTANGKPGLHHVLARAFKDIIPRYKTMKGFRVERKAGWDTHGLPVEIQVEKELGIHQKSEIENIVPGNPRESIIEFNKKCKESVWKYKDLWEKMTRRMGYWVDLAHPYITYENKYIESVWWIFAQIFKTKNKKGESLIYKGHKVVPYCYRCGTALSSHEVAQGYQKVKDNSLFVKFKAKKDGKIITDDNTYFLVWTTTPWTLPGNVALAINKDLEYEKYESLKGEYASETFILAKDTTAEAFKNTKILPINTELNDQHAIAKVDYIKGSDLLGIEYEPLYKTNDTGKKSYYVISGDFITTQEGTGIVHIAPAFGEDDARVGKENDLPTILTVDAEGKIITGKNIPGEGILVKKKNDKNRYEADELIISDLKKRNLLFKEEIYEHDYPFCWRCDTPLIYYSKPSWFIRMSELREELSKNNKNINWIPEYIKEGRFGEWLKEAKDWAISRERYWGTPLPIWECKKCQETKVIESLEELEKLSGKNLEDLHKPFIDDVKLKCSCGAEMARVPEVMDVWFDSGSMPLAQFHYPSGATEEDIKNVESGKYFPADYISEAIDQTRGWFYTLHAIATLLHKAGKVEVGSAFKNVICLAHILDAKGKKMSKSRGNIIEPMDIMNEYGADVLRWVLFTINQPGMPKKFDVKVMRDANSRVFRMLWNSYSFFALYANIDRFMPSQNHKLETKNLLDKWIISELNILIKEVDNELDCYDVYKAAGLIEKFIDNLSNWYIRRSRKRFWKSENDKDKNEAYSTLRYVLITLAKLMAPFTPFLAEEIYKNLTGEESVHLTDFPEADEKLIDEKLDNDMKTIRDLISEGLQQRARAGKKVRQPLQNITVANEIGGDLEIIVKEELNVKDVIVKPERFELKTEILTPKVIVDTNITGDLRLEGQAREIIRFIQEMRKEAGYQVDNRIIVCCTGLPEVFSKFGDIIKQETLAENLKSEKLEEADLKKEFDIDGKKLIISIKKFI